MNIFCSFGKCKIDIHLKTIVDIYYRISEMCEFMEHISRDVSYQRFSRCILPIQLMAAQIDRHRSFRHWYNLSKILETRVHLAQNSVKVDN